MDEDSDDDCSCSGRVNCSGRVSGIASGVRWYRSVGGSVLFSPEALAGIEE